MILNVPPLPGRPFLRVSSRGQGYEKTTGLLAGAGAELETKFWGRVQLTLARSSSHPSSND
jgi:hypothetical protein